ncbi:hypothetical protein FPQ18DRAFT_409307 [Pyronema domesticum]|nr:hypothetical protein FPQ18DRAFT_409307 [Pyronema domesticum]
MLLMWPAQFVAPLLSGAVDWQPLVESVTYERIGNRATALQLWDNYLEETYSSSTRAGEVNQAFQYASMIAFSNEPLKMDRCRHLDKDADYPLGSQLDGASYPCIEIGKIEWNKDLANSSAVSQVMNSTKLTMIKKAEGGPSVGDLFGGVQLFNLQDREEIKNSQGVIYNYTDRAKYSPRKYCTYLQLLCTLAGINEDHGTYAHSGLKDSKTQCKETDQMISKCEELPESKFPEKTFASKKFNVVLVAGVVSQWYNFSIRNPSYICGGSENLFGTTVEGVPILQYFNRDQWPYFTIWGGLIPGMSSCYTTGKVHITAGVMRNVTGGNVLSRTSADIERPDSKDFEADRWVQQAFDLLPDVLAKIGATNLTAYSTSATPLWNNMDAYMKSIIQMAYTATWIVMDQTFRENTSPLVYKKEITLVQAHVKVERVWIWFGINLLFTLSGVLHMVLQQSSSRPVVIDTAAVAITTDISRLLDDEGVGKELGWKNMSYVTKEDVFGAKRELEYPNLQARERILLKLEEQEDGFVVTRKDG